jgi:hypothetical protein
LLKSNRPRYVIDPAGALAWPLVRSLRFANPYAMRASRPARFRQGAVLVTGLASCLDMSAISETIQAHSRAVHISGGVGPSKVSAQIALADDASGG